MLNVVTLGPASVRLGVPYLQLVGIVRGRTDLPGVGRAGRFHVVDVSKLDELREVLRNEGVIPSDGAEHLVPVGAGASGELVEAL
jgi:hypothetical protein